MITLAVAALALMSLAVVGAIIGGTILTNDRWARLMGIDE